MAHVHVLILCGMVSVTLCAQFKPLSHMSMGDTMNSMKQKMDTMEERLLSLESKEREDLPQKIKDEISVMVRDAVERFHEERSKHETNIEDIQMDSRHERNKRSVTLEELHQRTKEHEENVDKRLSDVEKSLEEISGRFDSDKNRFLIMDNHLLLQLQEVQKKTFDALEKIRSVEDEFKRALQRVRLNIESLEVKENLTRILVTSHIESQRDVEELFRKNITSSAETLRIHINESSLDFQNFTKSMRSIQNSLTEIEKDKGSANLLSKLDEDFKNLKNDTRAELQTIQAEIYPRVKNLEERCRMCDDVAMLDKTLKNHTSEIGALNRQLLDYENSCSEPPGIENGFIVLDGQRGSDRKHGSIVTYKCRGNKTLLGNGEMECRFGEWTGVLPKCVSNCNTEDLKDYDGLHYPKNTIIEHSKSLEISCNEGYSIFPISPFLFCNNGTWNVSNSICMKDCNTEDLKDYDGLYFPKSTTIEHSKSLEISCKEGYNISPISAFLFCNNGTWKVSDNICIKGTCDGQPPTLQNGKPKNFERQIGSHIQYECDRNFAMFGNSTVHCKSGKWEGQPPVCSLFDTTFYLEASGDYSAYIKCYSDDNSKKIEISRLPDSATGGRILTKGSNEKSAEVVFSDYHNVYGINKCEFKDGAQSTELVLPLQSYGKLYFVDPFKVANVGDTVVLQLNLPPTSSLKWKHNGVIVQSWNGKSKVEISDVKITDGGIYESYFADHPRSSNSVGIAFSKLTVRKCKANLYGEHCDQKCPDCYNGGICHDILGICLCPDGFIGNNCEKACPQGYQGADCSVACRSRDCIYAVHCKPDPYGCFCGRGYNETWCGHSCKPGAFGADCRQSCNCKNGPYSCNRFTGACSGGCAAGWTGDSCQIRVLN